MSKELVISANRHETRVALLEDDQLVEVAFQRANEYSLAGSIHKGRVTRVLPGMQSAFVDLGLERDTFLYVSDFLDEHEDIDRVTGDERPPRERGGRGRGRRGESQAAAAPAAAPAAPEAGGEAPPAEGGAEAAEAGAQERSTEGSDGRGERRGRRSRRKRRGSGGGRGGFPESKYADAGAAAEQTAEARPEQAEEDVDAAAFEDAPVLLPGESLAKYRRAGRAARSGETPVAAAAPASAPKASAGDEEEDIDNEYDEAAHFPRENAMPDAPEHPVPVEGVAAQDVPEPAAAPQPAEASPEEMEEAEEAAASGPVSAAFDDDDVDLDIQEMILGEVDAEEEKDASDTAEEAANGDAEEATEEAAEDGEDAGSGEETEGPAQASAQGGEDETGVAAEGGERSSATAEVRERGGRYPHRVSRRMRRRGRGGRGERAEGEARAEAPAESRREGEERRPSAQVRAQPSISELLKQGQEIIVQIAKEPLGQKGARITSHVALPGRFVVYMPTLEHMGVSRKIGSEEERLRLKRILQGRRPGPVGGFITRTAAEGRTEEEIAADMEFLYKLWQDIKAKSEKRPAPMLLHHDLDIVQRVLRDQLSDDFKAIWIDNEEVFENILKFVERFQPALVGKVKLYTREAPIFDAFGVTQELEKALRPKVWLKSGGYIVINQTEALVAIDVNTGKFVGKSNRLEDTIVKTNTEAIKEIVRQIRLRDLGGIIVIDFIDMDERKNRQKVMQALEEAMRVDRAPYKILQFNDFGLVAITRKRVKQSLERTLCSPCPHCDGAGYVKSVGTVVSEILTEARKMAPTVEGKDVMLRVHPDVAKLIKSHQNKYLEELEEVLRRPVLVKSDPLLHHEKFDLA